MVIIRAPIAVGNYYSLDKSNLIKEIETAFKLGPKEMENKRIVGIIVPHIPYQFGYFYAWAYSTIKKSNFILLGPNHLKIGAKVAIVKEGIWKTPLGEVLIDSKIANDLMKKCNFLEFDILPHNDEYCLEVQLPFLQYKFGSDFKIVPILMQNEIEDLFRISKILGENLASILKKDENWAIIATSNFSTAPKPLVEETDNYLISSILKMDGNEFYERIKEVASDVCGSLPIISLITAMKNLGIKKVSLLKYEAIEGVHPDPLKAIGCASITFA